MFPRPRRMTPRPPFNLFFQRRALPPPPPILPPMPRRFATPPLPSRKPPGPGFPQAPSPSDTNNTIWTKKFIAKMCVANLSILSTELLIAQRLRLKLADDQEKMVAASELAFGERHEEIAKKLQKLVEFEEEKKKERESAKMALERKVAEEGKIVKDLGSAADTLPGK